MSFKLLIVDDEPIIREGLKSTVPWANYDMEVVGVAEDGEAALDWLKNNGTVDLVLTDVRMPVMDGLQLANQIATQYPKMKIVMISGYDEFKYAQQAIQIGVRDYLLKPVDIDELMEVTQKVKDEMEEERQTFTNHRQLNISQAMYQQLFDGISIHSDTLRDLQSLSMYPFITMVQEYAKETGHLSEYLLDKWQVGWKRQIKDAFSKEGYMAYSVFLSENVLLTCVEATEAETTPSFIEEVVASVELPLNMVIYPTSILLGDLHEVYPDLLQGIERIAIEEQPVYSAYSPHSERDLGTWKQEWEETFVELIFTADYNTVKSQMQELFTQLHKEKIPLSNVKELFQSIIHSIVVTLGSSFNEDESIFYRKEINVHVWNSLSLLQKKFEEDVEKVLSFIQQKENKMWMIERAEHYIQSYYASDIKAHEVADVVNVSPNYFSTLFKQKTGKSFNEYLNELRVEKAKTLLEETPLKINEIAEMVGFHEYKYFVDVFKRFVHLTPTKYRAWMSSKEKVQEKER
ncbi:response regulator transcription factor [Radiobacillus deserti]|uniref:Response regulator n=1 Tax=Radiobacillus deserti TaxID=2594883 RepID=A0A516KEU7_9BACI|nr:response regulator [Radiobacillus deserti]QDP39942.1 response regulator [Radiobacillus deserti]